MSNNKQSSVDYLINELNRVQELYYGQSIIPIEVIAQAKSMHKEEIKSVMRVAFLDGLRSGDENYKAPHEDWEDYYIKAFDN